MMTNDARAPALYALLIGIDCYLPNVLSNKCFYRSLEGCVRDILHVEGFFRERLELPEKNILKLTATDAGARQPSEPREQWPTYENIVRAFQTLTEVARPGDQVYIHYSGHGGRSPTLLPELKGEHGLDESLVPTDIGNTEARYLRDVELAKLLKAMVDRRLVVTVVLDSCHSGGATRAGRATARGTGVVDTTARPLTSLVGTREELAATWRGLTRGEKRNMKLGSGWLPEPEGYVLLAACRPSESAYEYPFEGKESRGALTYWLLDSLQTVGPGLTYKQLHDRIVAKVHSQFEDQTPQLQGEGDRVVFGSERVRPHYGVTVLRVDESLRRVLLATGQSQGVREGSQFAVYERDATDFTRPDARVALATVSVLGAAESWADYELLRGVPIEQGADAVLYKRGPVGFVRKVRLLLDERTLAGADHESALDVVKSALAKSDWLEPADDDEPSDYQLSINRKGEYEIRDGSGVRFGGLGPAIRLDEVDSASKVAARLVHLARYRATLQLDNSDQSSPLASKLVVELIGRQKVYDPVDRPEPEPFDASAVAPTVFAGEWAFLRIKNASPRILNVVVLDLRPDWAISQLYPSGQDWFAPFDPGQEMILPLRASLPAGHEEGADVVKVIGAISAANFHWLELPPAAAVARHRLPQDQFTRLFSAFAAGKQPTRNLTPAAYPSQEWVTAQVELRINRTPAKVL